MKRIVAVTHTVEVKINRKKFTRKFMADFRRDFYNFTTIERHLEHLAQLYVRGIAGEFIEGYGPASEMGIEFRDVWTEMSFDD
jgi:hypothetical protein